MSDIKSFIQENKEGLLSELFELIRIPSISSKEAHKEDMYKAAGWIRDTLIKKGVDRAEVMETDGHPVVFAEKLVDPALPNVLVYGHYDVQPAEPLNLWKTPPFEPEVRNGRIYARGADDDKGQFYMHVAAFEYMIKANRLPCNVKFMVEGEEEIGSPSLGAFMAQHRDMLAADVILVSDTSMLGPDTPSITTGLRGLSYVEVHVTGPNRDLHSGLYGGAVANPINVLCKLIGSLTDEHGRITVEGFYDDVEVLSDTERAEMARAPFDVEAYQKELDIATVYGEAGYSTLERTGIRPSLDVNGIWGGHTDPGAKTVLPSTAHAKISMRLVPHQDSKKITALFRKHFLSIAPDYVKVEVDFLHGGEGYVSPTDTIAYQAASQAYEVTFGIKPIPVRSGGSIPIISLFEKILGIKSILMGFGLESDAIHSPNENYPLAQFFKGIETIPHFYHKFTRLKNQQINK